MKRKGIACATGMLDVARGGMGGERKKSESG
jgi:hypothetical protein